MRTRTAARSSSKVRAAPDGATGAMKAGAITGSCALLSGTTGVAAPLRSAVVGPSGCPCCVDCDGDAAAFGGGVADVDGELPGWAPGCGGVGAAPGPGPGVAGACTPGAGGGGTAAVGGGGARELPGDTGDNGAAGVGGGTGGGAGTAPAAADAIGLAAALTGGSAEPGAPPAAAADDTTPDIGATPAAGALAAGGAAVPPDAGALLEDVAAAASGDVDCVGPEACDPVADGDAEEEPPAEEDAGASDSPD